MKRIHITSILMMLTTAIMADQLTPDEALQRLANDKQSMAMCAKGAATGHLELAYTSTEQGLNSYYAFNNSNGGYVLLSADDCLPAVLATSDTDSFDYDTLPENMKWFLKLYDQAVANNSTTDVQPTTTALEPIEPLLEHSWLGNIRWDQAKPYYNMTPIYRGDGKHCYTGCEATAMAQIMAYHKWPEHGYGESTDTFHIKLENGKEKELTTVHVDFSQTKYDWDHLLPLYDTLKVNYNEAQADAVATLMYHCGVAAKMRYGSTKSEGSDADTDRTAAAFVMNFGYSKDLRMINHYAYTNHDFDSLMYEELKNKRPVMLAGGNVRGKDGHAFVCDGYKDGLFHMNWGWGNDDRNTYFYITGPLLNADIYTNPKSTENIFGYNLEALMGIQPDKEGTSEYKYTKMSTAIYSPELIGVGEKSMLNMQGYFYNNYYDTIRVYPGVVLMSEKDTLCAYSDSLYTMGSDCWLANKSYDNLYSVDITYTNMRKNIPYYIQPCYLTEDKKMWYYMTMCAGMSLPSIMLDDQNMLNLTRFKCYSMKGEAKASVHDNQKEFLTTLAGVTPDTLLLDLSERVYNIDPFNDIYLGVQFKDVNHGSVVNTTTQRQNNIYPGYYRDEIAVAIPDSLKADSTYYVYPLVWAYFFQDVNDIMYNNHASVVDEYLISDVKSLPQITMVKRKPTPTVIESVAAADDKSTHPTKFMRKGAILLRRGKDVYTTSGQRIE